MTLAEFCEKTNVYCKPYFPPKHELDSMGLHVCIIPDNQVLREDRWTLHHLTDYVVSSISAGTIWLVQR